MDNLALARDYINKGKYDLAIVELKRTQAADARNDEAHILLGLVYQDLKEFDLALNEFKIALEINPNNLDVFTLIGNIYNKKGDYDAAIKAYSNNINSNAKNISQSYFELGKIYENDGKYDEAIREYEKSLKAEFNKDLLTRLIQTYRLAGKWQRIEERVLNDLSLIAQDDLFTRNLLLNELEIAQKKTVLATKIRSFTITLTNRCNLSCSMCVAKKIDWEMPKEVIKEIIEHLPYLEHIMWQGGEVFLFDDFADILEETKVYPHIKQLITTNGLLLTEDLIAKLTLQPELVLTISVDGVTRDVYENIRRGAKFDRLIENINLINSMRKRGRSNLSLHLNVTVMRSNYHQLSDFIEFAKDYEFSSVLFAPASQNTCIGENLFFTDRQDEQMLRCVTEGIKHARDKAREYEIILDTRIPTIDTANKDTQNRKNKAVVKHKGFFCYAPWQRLYINWDGNVYPDCMCTRPYDIGIGNVKRNSIRDIWNNEGMQMYRRKMIENDYMDLCNPACTSGMIPERYLKLNR